MAIACKVLNAPDCFGRARQRQRAVLGHANDVLRAVRELHVHARQLLQLSEQDSSLADEDADKILRNNDGMMRLHNLSAGGQGKQLQYSHRASPGSGSRSAVRRQSSRSPTDASRPPGCRP